MAYYDPHDIIDSGDVLITSVESLIKLPKTAVSCPPKGMSFVPPVSRRMQWDVKVGSTGNIMRLKQHKNTIGFINVVMFYNGSIVRLGHFNRKQGHTNPNKSYVPPPHHIHFPTMKFPNLDRSNHKYAFRVKCNNTLTDTLTAFCDTNNIDLTPYTRSLV